MKKAKYYCKKCKRNHYYDSNIGRKHNMRINDDVFTYRQITARTPDDKLKFEELLFKYGYIDIKTTTHTFKFIYDDKLLDKLEKQGKLRKVYVGTTKENYVWKLTDKGKKG